VSELQHVRTVQQTRVFIDNYTSIYRTSGAHRLWAPENIQEQLASGSRT